MPKVLLTILCLSVTTWVTGQSVYTEFGKNRVQYHDDFKDWWMYETENFVTYWYGKGRNIAQSVIQIAEHDNDEIQGILEHRFNDKIEIVVYVDVTDMKQSNIGAEETFASTSGRTTILGNKMFVSFNGDHQQLRLQIRNGIAAVYLESMLYGSNLQEVVQNAVLLNLPDWYKDGLIRLIAEDWSPVHDNQMIDVLSRRDGRFRDFYRLVKEDPGLAGHSLWHYISRTYGKSTIANILYLTRINRNLDNAILYVLGIKFSDLIDGWSAYVNDRYPEGEAWSGNDLLDLPKRMHDARVSAMSLSPDGGTLVYALNEFNKTRIYLYDVASGRKARIFKYGKKNIVQEPDYQYPCFAWRQDQNFLSVLYEERDVPRIVHFDFENNTRVTDLLSTEFQRVYSMDYWHPDTLIFAAATDGFSDIYKYALGTRQTQRVTEDYFDDLEVRVDTLANTKGVLFASNRTDDSLTKRPLGTELPLENFDIYFLYPESGGWRLRNLTQTRFASERQPVPGEDVEGGDLAMISRESGLVSRKLLDMSTPPYETTRVYDPRVVTHHTSAAGRTYVASIAGGIQRITQAGETILSDVHPGLSEPGRNISPDEQLGEQDAMDFADPRYLFQSPFVRPDTPAPERDVIVVEPLPRQEQTEEIPESSDQKPVNYEPERVIEFKPVRAVAHRLRFKLDYVTTTMDNSLLFTSLDTYAATKQQYENPPLGILLKANLKDLLEDYIIEGGARFPTSFNGSEYFLYLDDRKKRFDKRYAFYRKSTTETITTGPLDIDRTQTVSVIGQYRLSYPFDTYTSLRATGTIRNDRLIRLATDATNLNSRIADDQRAGLKLEFVYDNTVEWELNSRHGTRYKVWVEAVKKFDLNLFEPGDKLTFNEGFMTVFGVDARHYQPLDKHTVLAGRLFASTSLGSERLLYYLGGVENWMFASFDNTVPVPGDKNFAYQSIAASMRGFNYNARNGSSVVLVNAELRIPFIRYFSRGKIRSAFLRNIQAVGFLDVGTAWHGRDPFSDENPLNTLTLVSPPTVRVDVKYFRNPVVVGYGAGLRALVFGYYVKADYAWGWETGRRLDPKLYLSLGLDF